MDDDFEKLKVDTENDLGRAIDADEERHLKALYYFGKGVKLKAELDAGPEHISTIAGRALADIDRRRRDHRESVVEAVKGFLAGQRKPAMGRISKVRAKHVRE